MEHEQTSREQRKEEETDPHPDAPDLPPTAAEPSAAVLPPAAAEPPAAEPPAVTAPRRRRGRTTLLIAGATVLGVLAGTITGYAVQYHRDPTPLPPLAQQQMAMPKPVAPNDATSFRSINANRWDKADEDLAKKLVEAPGGAKDGYSGYQAPDEFAADYYERPTLGFSAVATGVRRIATAGWQQGEHDFVEIRLLQFHDQSDAQRHQQGHSSYQSDERHAGNDGFALPGVPDDYGRAWVSDVKSKPGYHPLRAARAIVRRGDIVMDVEITNRRGDVSEREITDLAKRQLERL